MRSIPSNPVFELVSVQTYNCFEFRALNFHMFYVLQVHILGGLFVSSFPTRLSPLEGPRLIAAVPNPSNIGSNI